MSSTGATSGRRAFRDAIVARLVPTLRAFNPELIMLSTGFDALAEDVGNSRSGDKGAIMPGIDLSSEDFFWVTREIQTVSRISPPAVLSALLACYTPFSSPPLPIIFQIADMCCGGRVVSVLEGGYGCMPGGTLNLSKPGAFTTRSAHARQSYVDMPVSPNARDQLDRVSIIFKNTFRALL